MTDSPATDWAWEQVSSPNLDFTPTEALVFLAAAHQADVALTSPNGYVVTTIADFQHALPRVEFMAISTAIDNLYRAGSLARFEATAHHPAGYRIPEDAFNRHLGKCSRCAPGKAAFLIVTKGAGTRPREEVCPGCASRLVASNEVASITPLEAVHA